MFHKSDESVLHSIHIKAPGLHHIHSVDVVAIGCSTGGPPVVKEILAHLPADYNLPILLVQHIWPGFGDIFTNWLDKTTQLKVKVAEHGESLVPGCCYIAPDDIHMKVTNNRTISLVDGPLINYLCPSVSFLFDSVVKVYGEMAIGILLTGMGADGAKELKKMHDRGATTVGQNRESSAVFGMASEALKLGAVDYLLPPHEIVELLLKLG